MRYDLYIAYFTKGLKMKEPIDSVQSSKMFNIKELDKEISTMTERTSKFTPKRTKEVLITLGSFAALWVFSWQLALAFVLL